MKDNDEDDLLLESGITDFWVLNSSYKQLITTTEMKNMNNNELLTAIQMNFKNFNDFNINDEMHKIKVSYNESDLYSAETDGRDIETQVIFMWRFKHYWINSKSAKTGLSKMEVNGVIRKYKFHVKKLRYRKLEERRIANLSINDQQIDSIKQYIERTSNIPVKISMIKNAVWPQSSGIKAPWNSTISKALKKKLGMSYKVLYKWNIKRKDPQNQRLFIESLYLQTNLRNREIEAICIDEFMFSSRN